MQSLKVTHGELPVQCSGSRDSRGCKWWEPERGGWTGWTAMSDRNRMSSHTSTTPSPSEEGNTHTPTHTHTGVRNLSWHRQHTHSLSLLKTWVCCAKQRPIYVVRIFESTDLVWVCVYLLYGCELRPEVTGDGCNLQRKEGQRPVLSERDGELYTSGIHPERRERQSTGGMERKVNWQNRFQKWIRHNIKSSHSWLKA